MKPSTKTLNVELPISEELYKYFENLAQFIENETGRSISMTSILVRVMEKGLPQLEADVQRMRAKSNEKARRFPALHLAFTASAH